MSTPEAKLAGYIQHLESTNRKLTFALMQCIEILKTVKPSGDYREWEKMVSDFEKIARETERVEQ